MKIQLSLSLFLIMMASRVMSTDYHDLSSLEKSVADEGLKAFGLKPNHNPHKKIIGTIYVYTKSPFGKDSGFLMMLNHLHKNTRPSVIKQQIAFKEGDVFDEAVIEDSQMSLRYLGLVRSVAVIIPVTSAQTSPTKTDILVVTKDILSLQPTFNFSGSGVGSSFFLTNLSLGLAEHNLFGLNKSLLGLYEMEQGAHIATMRYFDPAIFNSSLQFLIKPSVLWTRSLAFDGFLGDFKLEKPLRFEKDRVGYGIEASYGSRSMIDFSGNKVRTVEYKNANGVQNLEKKYRSRYGKGLLFGRYSLGTTYKKEFLLGYGVNIKRPLVSPELNLNAEQIDFFKSHVLPRNEVESFIKLGFSYFHNRFLTLYDYDNFKLQENIRLGPSITITNDFAARPVLMSDHSFLRPEAKLVFTHNIGHDAFFSLTSSSSNRYDGIFTDNLYKFGLSLVSPKLFGVGRAVAEGRLSLMYDNRDNQQFVLGSDSGLRGVYPRFYAGTKGFRSNFELRSLPIDMWIFHVGVVLFYDVGSAFNAWSSANATHALGFGLRFLAPQISSTPFRIDLAFPIYGVGKNYHGALPSFGTGQAF